MTETLTADAVVVGSGVIGSAVALELARGGRSVLVLDKAGGPGHGSTSASSAVIRFIYSTFDGVATAWESKFCWEAWSDHLGLPGFEPLADPPALTPFHRTGMLHLDVPAVPREHSADLLERRRAVRGAGRRRPRRALPAPRRRCLLAQQAGRRRRVLGGDRRPGSARSSPPTPGTWTTPGWPRTTSPTPPGCTGRAPPTAPRYRRRAPRETWRLTLADGRLVERRSSSTPPARGRAPSTRWRGSAPSSPSTCARCGRRCTRWPGRPIRREDPASRVFDLDLGTYMPARPDAASVVGGTEPECDPMEWIDDADAATPTADRPPRRGAGDASGATDAAPDASRTGRAAWSGCTTSPTTGRRSTTAPTGRGSTWRWGPAATSSRTRRSAGPLPGHDHRRRGERPRPRREPGDLRRRAHRPQDRPLGLVSRVREVNDASSCTVLG